MEDNQRKVLLDWMRKIHQNEYAHRFQSLAWNDWHYIFSVSALIGGVIIGALSAFNEIEIPLKYSILAFLGLIVALCSGLQTFLKPQELAEEHKQTSGKYESLRHRIEFLLQFENNTETVSIETEKVRKEWDNINSLNTWERIYRKARNKVKDFDKYPEELSFLDTLKKNNHN